MKANTSTGNVPPPSVPSGKPELRRGLYLVLTSPRDGYERLAGWAVAAGVAAVQLRPKGEEDRTVMRVARSLREITRGSRTLFLVNDRPDIAALCDADGVHLGQTDLAPGDARRVVGGQRLIGWSTHSLEQVRLSRDEPEVDYIGFGPIHATPSKAYADPVTGPEALQAVARMARHPVVAIGGLDADRVAALDRTLFHCAAVIRAVADADDPPAVLRQLQSLLENKP